MFILLSGNIRLQMTIVSSCPTLVNKTNLVHNFSYFVFFSFLYMFRANMCPSSGEITVSMRHLVFVTLCGWLSVLKCANQTVIHTVTNIKCRIDTVISPDDGHIVARNMYRKEINILRKIVHQVGFIYKIIRGSTVNRT